MQTRQSPLNWAKNRGVTSSTWRHARTTTDLEEYLAFGNAFDGFEFFAHEFTSNSELTDAQRSLAQNADITFTYAGSTLSMSDIDTADMAGTLQLDADADGIGDACD